MFSLQYLNSQTPGITGYVTDLKFLDSGDIVFLDRGSSRLITIDKDFNYKKIIGSEFSYNRNYLNDPLIPASVEGKFIKAIYNRELGDNGVLYLVFSHDLDAWHNGVTRTEDSDNTDLINVRPEKFNIRSKGITYDLSGLTVVACDRGILCFTLSAEVSNWIESLSSPEIDTSFDPTSTGSGTDATVVAGTESCVKFNDPTVIVSTNNNANIVVDIDKVGNKGIYTGNTSIIYMPIQGTVAFDIDDDGNYYVLKKTRPYTWDTSAEPWYLSFDPDILWAGYDSALESSSDFPAGSLPSGNTEPNFFLNYIYGYKGSIQKKSPYLLMCISGEGKDGLLVFYKDSTTGTYSLPTAIDLADDGTYPMDARFDLNTFVDSSIFDGQEYRNMYVALSDLRTTSSSLGKSRVAYLDVDGDEEWSWGSNAGQTRTISVNSVRPLEFLSGLNGVIIST